MGSESDALQHDCRHDHMVHAAPGAIVHSGSTTSARLDDLVPALWRSSLSDGCGATLSCVATLIDKRGVGYEYTLLKVDGSPWWPINMERLGSDVLRRVSRMAAIIDSHIRDFHVIWAAIVRFLCRMCGQK